MARFEERARGAGAVVEQIDLAAADGALLRATYARLQAPTGRGALLLHGIGGHRLQLEELAVPLLEAGYDVLLLDLRAHGESGGAQASFGFRERDDCARAGDFLESRGVERLYLAGASYGGAVALAAAAHDARWRAVVVGAGFAYYRSTALAYASQYVGMPDLLVQSVLALPVDLAVRACGFAVGSSPDLVEPIESAAHVRAPLFVIHGEKDPAIGTWQARALLEASPASRKDLWIVPGAGHDRSSPLRIALGELSERVRQWFDATDPMGRSGIADGRRDSAAAAAIPSAR